MRLLLSLGETGQLTLYKALTERLKTFGYEIVFVCDREDTGVASVISAAASEVGATFIDFYQNPVPPKHVPKPILERVRGLILKDQEIELEDLEIEAAESHYRGLIARAETVMTSVRPDILLLGEDGIACSTWMVKAARNVGAHVVVVPYGLSPSLWLVEKGIPEKERRGDLVLAVGPLGEVVRRDYPHWVREVKQGPVIMFPPAHIIARENLGIGLPNPWNIQGGTADVIAVESDYMMKRFVELERLSPEKLAPIGSTYCDELYDVIRSSSETLAAFERSSKIRPHTTRVLVSLPPSDHDGWGGQCEFPTYVEMCVEFDRGVRRIPGIEVVYSLHPRTMPHDRYDLEQAGFTFVPGFVLHHIARNDLFVSFSSSLNRWALAARKRVINYDAYRFGIDDIGDEVGHFHTEFLAEVLAKIRAYTETDLFDVEAPVTKARSAYFGVLDGMSTRRLSDLLKQFSSHEV